MVQKEELLADQIVFAARHADKKMTPPPLNGKHRAALKRVVDDIVSSQKFILDDKFTFQSAITSVDQPRVVQRLSWKARSPYEKTWIEWNDLVRLDGLKTSGLKVDDGPNSAVRVGCLIRRDPLSPTRHMVEFFSADKEGLGMLPFAIEYDTETELSFVDVYYRSFHEQLKRHVAYNRDNEYFYGDQLPSYVLLGGTWIDDVLLKISLGKHDEDQAKDLAHLMKKCRFTWSRYSGLITNSWLVDIPADRQAIAFITLIKEQSGDARWIMTMLGMINTFELVTDASLKGKHLSRPWRLSNEKIEYMTYHRLGIKAPQERPLEYIQRTVLKDVEMTRKRAHTVRGHFCVSRKTGQRWWRNEHVRGDASLGWVQKDHVIQASGKKLPREITSG